MLTVPGSPCALYFRVMRVPFGSGEHVGVLQHPSEKIIGPGFMFKRRLEFRHLTARCVAIGFGAAVTGKTGHPS